MTDAQIFELLEQLEDAPRLTVGRWRYEVVPGRVVTLERIGKGERWALSPSRGVDTIANFLERPQLREVRRFVELAARMDVVAHARAMGARVL